MNSGRIDSGPERAAEARIDAEDAVGDHSMIDQQPSPSHRMSRTSLLTPTVNRASQVSFTVCSGTYRRERLPVDFPSKVSHRACLSGTGVRHC